MPEELERPTASTEAETLARRAVAWQSLCGGFLAGGVLLAVLGAVFAFAPELPGVVPATVLAIAAFSFVMSYASRRACDSCQNRCDALRR
jgi:membrane protein implicated in regulation of membrane protease activity